MVLRPLLHRHAVEKFSGSGKATRTGGSRLVDFPYPQRLPESLRLRFLSLEFLALQHLPNLHYSLDTILTRNKRRFWKGRLLRFLRRRGCKLDGVGE
ncbi:hypothetical protein M407DRAFT_129296 [Tulasnella calospora MUT 4182]|uniref:Uncharacterized protein n=1 Tax=Tulasnella calospora MUT 4182 TaxID=1051891 RepID=A0A0C3Q9M5_9AGAM|nr:hypothetical protein M407DRAFT_129296 [Tulasnella calospora MUT 4182]